MGTSGPDNLVGTAAADNLRGLAGDDCLAGRAGADTLRGGPDDDTMFGEAGDDRILARDGRADDVNCGSGRDKVVADHRDRITKSCEIIDRPGKKRDKGP